MRVLACLKASGGPRCLWLRAPGKGSTAVVSEAAPQQQGGWVGAQLLASHEGNGDTTPDGE